LADAEARRVRDLWVNDLDSISAGLASLLKIFLEQHIGLRPYYPEIEKFYRDVQTGRIETPLPQDAVDGFVKGVRDNYAEGIRPIRDRRYRCQRTTCVACARDCASVNLGHASGGLWPADAARRSSQGSQPKEGAGLHNCRHR
jgi:hypothetical protein